MNIEHLAIGLLLSLLVAWIVYARSLERELKHHRVITDLWFASLSRQQLEELKRLCLNTKKRSKNET